MRYEFYLHRSIVVPTLAWTGTSYEKTADLLTLRDRISFLSGVIGNVVSLSTHLLPAVRLNLPVSEKKILMAASSRIAFEHMRDNVGLTLNELASTKEGTGRIMFKDSWILFHKPYAMHNFIRIIVDSEAKEDFLELPLFEIKLRAKRL